MYLVGQQVLSLSLLLLAVGPAFTQDSQPAQPSEYQLKAAFLYNFAKFVEWPPRAFAEDSSPVVIGIIGDNPFGENLERTVRNKFIGGHPLLVKTSVPPEEWKRCHILFVSNSENRRLREILESLHGSAVLTVGETSRFIDNGGVINFVIEGQKIRFEINRNAASEAGLKISSKLLSLAARTTP
jgi:hypothetical protein